MPWTGRAACCALLATCAFLAALAPVARAQSADAFTALHTFEAADTDADVGPGLGRDGNFYGTSSPDATGGGTVFVMTPTGVMSTLHRFGPAGSAQVAREGASPQAVLLTARDGSLYGVTSQGGAAGAGTIFRLTPAGGLTALHSFAVADRRAGAGSPDGLRVTLLEAADGNLYGTTTTGGANGLGTVFQLTPAGGFTTLHSFGGPDGSTPAASLVQGGDGSFYGTTSAGGANGTGTVFRLAADGTLTTLHHFAPEDGAGHNADGARPRGSLWQSKGGSLFGTTSAGGANGGGTVFRLTHTGVLTVLHDFGGLDARGVNEDGARPRAGLLVGADGAFYGTTLAGGANGGGTVFRLTRAGVLPPSTRSPSRTAAAHGAVSCKRRMVPSTA